MQNFKLWGPISPFSIKNIAHFLYWLISNSWRWVICKHMYNTLKMDEKSLNLHITMIQSNIYCSFFIILLHVLYLFFSIATYEKCLDQQHTKPIDPGDFIYASLNLHIKIIIQSINNYISIADSFKMLYLVFLFQSMQKFGPWQVMESIDSRTFILQAWAWISQRWF
jgi:hypothetical protein